MFHRFIRHIKEGFIGVKRNFSTAASTITAVTVTLILVSIFLVITWNLQTLTESIESSISIVVSIDYDYESKAKLDIIENQIKAIDGIVATEYRSKEEEFDFYAQSQGEQQFYEHYRDMNPFHPVFLVNVEDSSQIETICNQIKSINGVYGVYDGGNNTYTLVSLFHNVRLYGGGMVIALFLLSIYLVYNTIKITISARQDEIRIMRNVGARNGYIRAPFLVEGVIIGSIGSIIASGLTVGIYYYLYTTYGGSLFGIFSIAEPYPFLLVISGILFGVGIIVGVAGSWLSVFKYLRKKR